jgi:hypothetical protein
MRIEIKPPHRFADAPRDKPQLDRLREHANLERPGAQAHPRATRVGWEVHAHKQGVWRLH